MPSTSLRFTSPTQAAGEGTRASTDPHSLVWQPRLVSDAASLRESPEELNRIRPNLRGLGGTSQSATGNSSPRGTSTGPKLPAQDDPTGRVSPRQIVTQASSARSQVLAEWHGQVISIESDYFVAELKGTIGTGVKGSLEEAQIPVEEVRSDDRELLREGAFFRLCVNWELVNGSRRRVTDLVFRRMPAYRRDELEAARATAANIFHALRVE